MAWFTRADKTRTGLIDLSSDGVTVAVLAWPAPSNFDQLPEVIFSGTRAFNWRGEWNQRRFLATAFKNLEDLLTALKQKHGWPKDWQVILGSPFYWSQTKIIKTKEPEPFVVTSALLRQVIDREIEPELVASPERSSELANDQPVVMESRIMQLRLNGYDCVKPDGQIATDLAISHFTSFASKQILERLRQLLTGEAGRPPAGRISFTAWPFVAYSVLRDFLPEERNYVLIDVTERLTDLFVVRDQALTETGSFPQGRAAVIEQIAAGSGTSVEAVKSLIDLRQEGKLTAAAKRQTEAALMEARSRWLGAFRQAFETMLAESFVPSRFFLFGDRDLAPLFADWARRDELSAALFGNQSPRLEVLSSGVFNNFCRIAPGEITNTQLLMESLFCAKIKRLSTP